MQIPPTPDNEAERLQALDSSGLLSSGADPRFDRITRLASQMFSVPIALVSLIDHERQWFKSRQGLDVTETPRAMSFCGHTILDSKPLIIEDALLDERFCDNPLVTAEPHIRFYAGAPLHTAKGFRLGTLCLIDTKPNTLSDAESATLRDLANMVEDLIQIEEQRDSEIRQSQLILQNMLDSIIIIDAKGMIRECNPATSKIFGYQKHELIGQNVSILMPSPHRQAHDGYLRNFQRTGVARIIGIGREVKGQRKDGSLFDIDLAVSEIANYAEPLYLGRVSDISNRARIKEVTDEYLAKVSLIDNMPGIIYRCLPDENYTMLYISTQIQHLSGYSADEFMEDKGVCYADLIHPDDALLCVELKSKAMNEDSEWHIEYRVKHKNLGWRWVEERGKCIKGDSRHPIILEGFIVDISREHSALQQLEQHHQALKLLNAIAFTTHDSLELKILYALQEARRYLKADMAIVSQIEQQIYHVLWVDAIPDLPVVAGQQFALNDTWCNLLITGAGVTAREKFIAKADSPEFHSHPCYHKTPLGSYAGIVIEVEGQPWGTLNLSSARSRYEDYSDGEKLFLRLLANWLSEVLTHSVSQKRLSKLNALLPGATYQFRLYPDGRKTFPFSTPQIKDLTGLTPVQAAEDADPAFARIHPDDIESVYLSIQQSASTLQPWEQTFRVDRPEQGYRWTKGEALPEWMLDGSVLWHGYLHDTHEAHLAALALEQSEARLRSLFAFSPIGIALIDFATGQFLDINNALMRATGYSQEDFVQLRYHDITPSEYRSEEQQMLSSLQQTGRYGPIEKEYICKDGSRIPVRLQGMLSRDKDNRQVIWSLIEDISERKKLDKMKNQFISTVSHELRTPLTSIKGALGLLAGGAVGELAPKAELMVKTAERNAARLVLLINDLLDMEKLVAGQMPMKLQVQPLGPLLDEAIESVKAYKNHQQIALHTPEQWPDVKVKVDEQRLLQALINLLSNAIKFSPAGERIEITVAVLNQQLEIRIRDHGPGVAPEFQPKLFQRFSQADNADNRVTQGTGLGLAITREICQQMQGEAGYRDAEGGGALFFIQLQVQNER